MKRAVLPYFRPKPVNTRHMTSIDGFLDDLQSRDTGDIPGGIKWKYYVPGYALVERIEFREEGWAEKKIKAARRFYDLEKYWLGFVRVAEQIFDVEADQEHWRKHGYGGPPRTEIIIDKKVEQERKKLLLRREQREARERRLEQERFRKEKEQKALEKKRARDRERLRQRAEIKAKEAARFRDLNEKEKSDKRLRDYLDRIHGSRERELFRSRRILHEQLALARDHPNPIFTRSSTLQLMTIKAYRLENINKALKYLVNDKSADIAIIQFYQAAYERIKNEAI